MYMGSGAMPGFPAGSSPAPTSPIRRVDEPAVGGLQIPPNEVGPQATRAAGPSAGYDASYLQNLSSYIGSLFSKPAGAGNVTSFNPLGTLNDISPLGGQIGNAPGFGAPMTWLQQALNGGGFSYAPSAPPAPTKPEREPIDGGFGRGRGPRGALFA